MSYGAGGGHDMAAKALQEAVEKRGGYAEAIDPFSVFGGRLLSCFGSLYNKEIVYAPKTFGLVYWLADRYRNCFKRSPVSILTRRMAAPVGAYIEKKGFDVIFTTHPLTCEIMTRLEQKKTMQVPLTVFVATDYTCEPFIDDCESDAFVIAHEDNIDEYEKHGAPKQDIYPLGIPLRSSFSKSRMIEKNSKGFSIVIAGGYFGSGKIIKVLDSLFTKCSLPPATEITVMTGTNCKLKRKLERGRYGGRVNICGYIEDPAPVISNADVFISKAGGISTTEAACLKVPIIHIDTIPGCESRNARLFERMGMSIFVRSLKRLPEAIRTVQSDYHRQSAIKAMEHNINPNAAEDIAELAEQLLKRDGKRGQNNGC